MNVTDIWTTKAAYEAFSKQSIRSAYLAELARNNHSYRHVARFLGNIAMAVSSFGLMQLASNYSTFLAVAVFPIYLFLQGLIISGMMIHSHELSHNQIKSRLVNDAVGILSGMVSFINFYSFQRAHRMHHRNIGNLDAPEAGAPISLSGQKKLLHEDKSRRLMAALFDRSYLLGFLLSWPIYIYYGDYNSWLLPFQEQGKTNRKSVGVFLAIFAVNLLLLCLYPVSYLLFFLLPVLFGGQRILAITYMHHAHEDSVFFSEKHHNFFSIIMATTDRDYGPMVNFFMMNNGYHIPHHLNPKIAYYDLKKASEYLRKTIPPELKYNFYPNSRFYRDFAFGLYEQRLDSDHEFYQLKFLKPDVPGLDFLKRMTK